MDFSKINKIGSIVFNPTKPLKNLIGNEYPIKTLVGVKTKFWPRIKAVLLEDNDEEFETFLPPRICKHLSENEALFLSLQQSDGKLLLCVGESSKVQFKNKV